MFPDYPYDYHNHLSNYLTILCLQVTNLTLLIAILVIIWTILVTVGACILINFLTILYILVTILRGHSFMTSATLGGGGIQANSDIC